LIWFGGDAGAENFLPLHGMLYVLLQGFKILNPYRVSYIFNPNIAVFCMNRRGSKCVPQGFKNVFRWGSKS
jgi:hypothetical protein